MNQRKLIKTCMMGGVVIGAVIALPIVITSCGKGKDKITKQKFPGADAIEQYVKDHEKPNSYDKSITDINDYKDFFQNVLTSQNILNWELQNLFIQNLYADGETTFDFPNPLQLTLKTTPNGCELMVEPDFIYLNKVDRNIQAKWCRDSYLRLNIEENGIRFATDWTTKISEDGGSTWTTADHDKIEIFIAYDNMTISPSEYINEYDNSLDGIEFNISPSESDGSSTPITFGFIQSELPNMLITNFSTIG